MQWRAYEEIQPEGILTFYLIPYTIIMLRFVFPKLVNFSLAPFGRKLLDNIKLFFQTNI